MGVTIVIHPLKRDHRGTPARFVISVMCSNLMRMIRLPKKKRSSVPAVVEASFLHSCVFLDFSFANDQV